MKRIVSILVVVFLIFCLGYVACICFSTYEYRKEMIKIDSIMEDPDYQDWEDDEWDSRIYTIDDLTD